MVANPSFFVIVQVFSDQDGEPYYEFQVPVW